MQNMRISEYARIESLCESIHDVDDMSRCVICHDVYHMSRCITLFSS